MILGAILSANDPSDRQPALKPTHLDKWKEAAGLGPTASTPCSIATRSLQRQRAGWIDALFELSCDAIEGGVEAGADHIDGGDDNHRNTGGDQTVFNRGSS